jgi:hypothetical protein
MTGYKSKKKATEDKIKEIAKLVAEETLQATDAPKKKKTTKKSAPLTPNVDSGGWPKINQGSHLTVKTFEDGRTELIWDDEALTRDVQKALTDYENSVKVNTVKTTKRKKKNEA